MVIGSGHMFSDKYIDQENNDKFRMIIFDFLKAAECANLAYLEHSDTDVGNSLLLLNYLLYVTGV